MGCGSNFMCKLKKKGHGPLSRWADFNILLQVHVLIFSIFAIFGPFFMFFDKNLLILLLVFRNCYLKEVATNTHPWGWEITIQNCHLGFHIDISSTEKNKGPSPNVYPKAGYHLFPPITSLHFFGLRPFSSRCKQPFIPRPPLCHCLGGHMCSYITCV
jgi:hypothetical protein